jgi:hypothetical protein
MEEAKSLHDQLANWCKNFNGLQYKQCKAGIHYTDVRDVSVRPFTWPCFKDNNCSERCAHVVYLTEEEIAAKEKEIFEQVERHLTTLAANACPICHKPIHFREQIGMCWYARPCGHRLGTMEG